mmetsp:Transcript_2092/g.6053  ORF Transcript_2092/g.6053 Transcript_2092/m.6053 type:complete len:211 (+) Transcript_2092:527-1159(+)
MISSMSTLQKICTTSALRWFSASPKQMERMVCSPAMASPIFSTSSVAQCLALRRSSLRWSRASWRIIFSIWRCAWVRLACTLSLMAALMRSKVSSSLSSISSSLPSSTADMAMDRSTSSSASRRRSSRRFFHARRSVTAAIKRVTKRAMTMPMTIQKTAGLSSTKSSSKVATMSSSLIVFTLKDSTSASSSSTLVGAEKPAKVVKWVHEQ